MSVTDTCATCSARQVDENHRVTCAYTEHMIGRVEKRASELEVPEVKARDLFAHLRRAGADTKWAADQAITVMDLGWRPVVGS
jgi:hypothetical protein